MTRAHLPPPDAAGSFVGTRLASVYLGVTERTVLRWCEDGTLPVAWRTPGGHRRISQRAVEVLAAALAEADEAAS